MNQYKINEIHHELIENFILNENNFRGIHTNS